MVFYMEALITSKRSPAIRYFLSADTGDREGQERRTSGVYNGVANGEQHWKLEIASL